MSLTHIDELPTAPNRLNKYTTFNTDAPIFIDALTPFITQLNTNLNTVSDLKPNRWNMGNIIDTNSFPPMIVYTSNPEASPKPSVEYISTIDQEYAYFKKYSQDINSYLMWFESLSTDRGEVDFWTTSLDISPLSEPMTRVMGEGDFNNRAIALSQSLREHTTSIQQVQQQADSLFNTIQDMGDIADTAITTIDCGEITDTTITN